MNDEKSLLTQIGEAEEAATPVANGSPAKPSGKRARPATKFGRV